MAPETDPLTALRDRLDRTEAAARELGRAASAARRGAAAPSGTPGAGWQTPGGEEEGAAAGRESELTTALVGLLDAVRTAIPDELAERLATVLRELLLAVRAVVDFALERMEARRRAPVEVQDIPIA